MSASRFLLPAGAAILMALISKGVASDAARRDGLVLEPVVDHAAPRIVAPERSPEVVSLEEDETDTDDELDDSTVP